METFDAISSRRNVRQFQDRPIPPEDLDRILQAALRTPSSMNEQRWDFVVCTDRSQLQELSGVWNHAGHVAASAATIALIAPAAGDVETRASIEYDLGQATMSMMIAAADLGIGSGHSAVGDQELARKILGLPEDPVCAYLIAFGYPADRPLTANGRRNRRPFDSVVHRGGW